MQRFLRWLWRLLFGGRYQYPRKSQRGRLAEDLFDPTYGYTYQIYDGRAVLLYVGKSKHFPYARFADHVKKSWWPHRADITVHKWTDLHTAGLAEEDMIRRFNPTMNKVRYTNGARVGYPMPAATYHVTHKLEL